MTQDEVRQVLIDRRSQLGWSRTRLARELGVSRQSIWNQENGHRGLNIELLPKWASALGLELQFTVGPSDEALQELPPELQALVARYLDLLPEIARRNPDYAGALKAELDYYEASSRQQAS